MLSHDEDHPEKWHLMYTMPNLEIQKQLNISNNKLK
jgi:hypothetical protein